MNPWAQQNQTQSELTWCPPTLQVHSSSKPGAPGRDSQTHTVTKYIKNIIISSKHAAFIKHIHSSWSFLFAVVNKRTNATFKRYRCSLIPVTSPARDRSASKQETSKRRRSARHPAPGGFVENTNRFKLRLRTMAAAAASPLRLYWAIKNDNSGKAFIVRYRCWAPPSPSRLFPRALLTSGSTNSRAGILWRHLYLTNESEATVVLVTLVNLSFPLR